MILMQKIQQMKDSIKDYDWDKLFGDEDVKE